MRIRKLLGIGLPMLLVILLLGGCGHNKAQKGKINTAYFVGEAIWPMSYSDHYYYKEEVPSEATVTVNGSTYTGTLDDVDDLCRPLPYVFLWYEGDGFQFRIGAHDGKCYSFSLDDPDVEVCTFDSSRGREMADAIVDDYISLNEYKVKLLKSASHNHSYRYYREVDGIETSDYILISFDCNGDFNGFSRGQLGAFKNVKHVDINEEEINKAIETKCKEFYLDDPMNFTGYEIANSDLLLVRTEANQCVLFYTVLTSHEQKSGEYTIGGGYNLPMVVIVDYEKYNWFKP